MTSLHRKRIIGNLQEEGRQAALDGRHIQTNPHKFMDGIQWSTGYLDARREMDAKEMSVEPTFKLDKQLTQPLIACGPSRATTDPHACAMDANGLNVLTLRGGLVIFKAVEQTPMPGTSRNVEISYHGGRKCWCLEDNRFVDGDYMPGDDCYVFGSLSEMIAEFTRRTGVVLPPVTLHEVGCGISHIDATGVSKDANNPWELLPGGTYQITSQSSDGPQDLVFDVSQRDNGALELIFRSSKPESNFRHYNPDDLWPDEWLSLKCVQAPVDAGGSDRVQVPRPQG